jgi:phosphoribosylformylglycinamidine synthase
MYWQFKEAIEGMGEACRAFDTPVTGGNVSFYNESPEASVYPTPVIGMVGLIEDLNHATTSYFKEKEDLVYILGHDKGELGGSEYLKVVHNLVKGDAPDINLETEKSLHKLLLKLIADGMLQSAHDISEGGVLTALAECCILNKEQQIGAMVTLPVEGREDIAFFSESQSRVIISIQEQNRSAAEAIMTESGFPFRLLGKTGGESLTVNGNYSFSLAMLSDIYYHTIERIMNEQNS